MQIIIVEDEAPIREGMAKILQKINRDYEVAGTASDGKEGYKLISKLEPDLVIMDIQMPKMDGLTMLKKLRAENNHCKVIILSAYSDFNYAKQAIELDIENYLLKPIKIPELKQALRQVEEAITKEQNSEQIFSIDNIFMGCINGQVHPDEKLSALMKEKYGFSVEDPAEVFVLWLGESYEEQVKTAKELLNQVGEHTVKFSSFVAAMDIWKMLVMVIYRVQGGSSQYSYFQKSVVPMLKSNLKEPAVCIWKEADQICNLPDALMEMREEREWNLLVENGTLLSKDVITKLQAVPLKYPVELQDRAQKAVSLGDKEALKDIYEKLFHYFREDTHQPSEIKDTIMHFGMACVQVYKENNEFDSEMQVQNIMRKISIAVSWAQIQNALIEFFDVMDFTIEEEDLPVSSMVQKAQQMIKKYYDQGITLEEIANKMFVSEEYLSTQFKKETGNSFTETIRRYRIEKIKELLTNTHLKLNQIAELAGYTDPKYMSKVFKEEVGMLPNEFRKSVH